MAENVCVVGGNEIEGEFRELLDAMQKDSYWIRFFVRPCCPAPSLEGACDMLDKLIGEVRAHERFSDDQKDQLAAAIEARKEWYPTSGLCRKRV